MPAYLQRIATHEPAWTYEQPQIRDWMKKRSPNAKTQRIIRAIYQRSGIDTRRSVLGDFNEGADSELYGAVPPSTGVRNAVYARYAGALAVEAARKTLDGIDPALVTHVVFVSCTGFVNPGPDFQIIRELGLSHAVQRYTLGFMGCYAAFPALRMAAQFCEADSSAVVLIVSLELCTLHMQIDDIQDHILANSLFADGCAAAVVCGRPLAESGYLLCGFASRLLMSGEAEMAWDIGNTGFHLVLSSYVPGIIGANVKKLVTEVLIQHGVKEVHSWAVHPGGRSILDKVEQSLELPPEALAVSRTILREHGNMSSATILYALKKMLPQTGGMTCAMAFGPGLTVETALLEKWTA